MNENIHLTVEVPAGSPGSSVFDLPSGVHQPSHTTGHGPESATCELVPLVSNDKSCVVISGGTGGNGICSAFDPDTCYVLPVSDDGGSSSEIIRVLGGPSVGDIRSRLVRLILPAPSPSPQESIKALLAHRLPADCSEKEARDEWREIVEGRSPLWSGIPGDRKETIRGFLVYFESELLRRAHKNFTFTNGSIGNYLLAAAQQFFRSLPSAIFLLQSITRSQANILPVLVTNHTVTIAAELDNGAKLVGQCEISHPVVPSSPFHLADDDHTEHQDPDSEMGETIHQRSSNVKFESQAKEEYEALPAPISRLFYINAYGMEIHPSPNPDYLTCLGTRDVLVYSCGSLWTSIIPCLSLKGVGPAIARSRTLRAKILLLNAKNDRETDGYTAADYLRAISRTLNAQYAKPPLGLGIRGLAHTSYPVSAFITDLVYLKGTKILVEPSRITAMGVQCWEIEGEDSPEPRFAASDVREALGRIMKLRSSPGNGLN